MGNDEDGRVYVEYTTVGNMPVAYHKCLVFEYKKDGVILRKYTQAYPVDTDFEGLFAGSFMTDYGDHYLSGGTIEVIF